MTEYFKPFLQIQNQTHVIIFPVRRRVTLTVYVGRKTKANQTNQNQDNFLLFTHTFGRFWTILFFNDLHKHVWTDLVTPVTTLAASLCNISKRSSFSYYWEQLSHNNEAYSSIVKQVIINWLVVLLHKSSESHLLFIICVLSLK